MFALIFFNECNWIEAGVVMEKWTLHAKIYFDKGGSIFSVEALLIIHHAAHGTGSIFWDSLFIAPLQTF